MGKERVVGVGNRGASKENGILVEGVDIERERGKVYRRVETSYGEEARENIVLLGKVREGKRWKSKGNICRRKRKMRKETKRTAEKEVNCRKMKRRGRIIIGRKRRKRKGKR